MLTCPKFEKKVYKFLNKFVKRVIGGGKYGHSIVGRKIS